MIFNELNESLDITIKWLKESESKLGGSSATFSIYKGWSNPYPETTGYIIPTLIEYGKTYNDQSCINLGLKFGQWLLDIQSNLGYWNGGLFPSKGENPSIFNTGQILFGLNALYNLTNDNKWLEAADRGLLWLSDGIGSDGLWSKGHYMNFNPTYYSHVAWPMLLVAKQTNNSLAIQKVCSLLDKLLEKRNNNGTFNDWEFKQGEPAFTHTIGYTIAGFLESSVIIKDWDRYGAPLELALEKLYKISELNDGRLPGAFSKDWKPIKSYSCLTGNSQIAICLLRLNQIKPDLRLVNAASKLVEYNVDNQSHNSLISGLNGGISGSNPIWAKYMRFRYPNWAAKYHADSIILLLENLKNSKC
jgi:hypothetical protein